MKEVIEKIKLALETDVPALMYVEEELGQMDSTNNISIAEKLPFVLIDIKEIGYENSNNLVQQGSATVIIRLFYPNVIMGATPEQIVSIWDIYHDVNKSLLGKPFLSPAYGVLIRKKMEKNVKNDLYSELQIQYSLQFADTSCKTELAPCEKKIKPVIHIEKNVVAEQ